MSRREEVFALFDKGATPSSPEVKAFKLKISTRNSYYYDWKKARGLLSSEPNPKGKRVVSELEMLSSPSEGEPKEPNEDEEELNGANESGKDKQGKLKGRTDGKGAPPLHVAGQGLTFSITISVKTLMLYQFAAAVQDDELTLGDFIDTCVEDTYRGRGLDLGLIKIGDVEK